jgi:predicted nucleic acid-binding protein
MLLLDTSALIDLEQELAARRVGPVRRFLGSHKSSDLACSTVSVGELAVGTDEGATRFFLNRLRKIALSEEIAYRAARLDRELRARGLRLGENDTWIAATALQYSATLLHSDGDFSRVAGLKQVSVKLPT